MSKASMQSGGLTRTRFSDRIVDKFSIVPISACVFALIVSPLLNYFVPLDRQAVYSGDARLDNRFFWPAMAGISILLVMQNRSRLGRLTWPPHIICLLAYLAFAGASVLWAFSPQSSFTRFVQQVMIVTSIVLPAMLAAPTADMICDLLM